MSSFYCFEPYVFIKCKNFNAAIRDQSVGGKNERLKAEFAIFAESPCWVVSVKGNLCKKGYLVHQERILDWDAKYKLEYGEN